MTVVSATTGTPAAASMRRLADCLAHWARRTPDAHAVSDEAGCWTYRQLAQRVGDAERYLRELGVAAGDRVMLVGENSAALAALILAAGRLDAWAVLENARRAPLEVDAVMRMAQPRRTVFVASASPDAAAHAARHGASVQDAPFGQVAAATGRCRGGDDDAGLGHDLGHDLDHDPDHGDPDAAAEPVHEDPREQVAVLIYTTGSTGTPKGVMLTHANLLYIAETMRTLRRLEPRDRVYGVLPITHVMGLSSGLLGTLASGAHIRLVARFSPEACLGALREDGITILQGAPAMFARLVKVAPAVPAAPAAQVVPAAPTPPAASAIPATPATSADTRPGPTLRFIAIGGAPLDPALKAQAEALFGLTLHNGYGLTEASATCWTRLDDANADCAVGPPTPGVEVSIRDAAGRAVPPGETGELWLRGANLMKGYYRAPELTARALDAHGWFNSEDLATQEADGRIRIVGRSKDLIIRSGFNVSPLEVETALNAHPGVQQSAVLGCAVQDNEEIVAVIEPAPGAAPSEQELQRFLAERLSPYKRPSRIVFVDALPVAPNGKVLKPQLRRLIGETP